MSLFFILYDHRAAAGAYDEAAVLDTADTAAEARLMSDTMGLPAGAVWYQWDCDEATNILANPVPRPDLGGAL